jgi:hypothetical protein
MTPIQPLLIAAASALVLAACASAPPVPKSGVPSPSAAVGLDQNAATSEPAIGSANAGGTYPYGTNPKADSGVAQRAAAETTDEIVVMSPDGKVWVRSGLTDQHYRSDVDSCYAYARGQVAHDARIEDDRSAAFQSEAGGLGLAALRGRMSHFERTRRVPSLFNGCMVAKGYSR